MEKPTLDDLLDDLNDLVESDREDCYGDMEYLYNGEWLDEDALLDVLIDEDEWTISEAGGFVPMEDLDLHFDPSFYSDDAEEEFDD